jgi:hypothetical protein
LEKELENLNQEKLTREKELTSQLIKINTFELESLKSTKEHPSGCNVANLWIPQMKLNLKKRKKINKDAKNATVDDLLPDIEELTKRKSNLGNEENNENNNEKDNSEIVAHEHSKDCTHN